MNSEREELSISALRELAHQKHYDKFREGWRFASLCNADTVVQEIKQILAGGISQAQACTAYHPSGEKDPGHAYVFVRSLDPIIGKPVIPRE